jgi:glucose/arabinose dehydrogenase
MRRRRYIARALVCATAVVCAAPAGAAAVTLPQDFRESVVLEGLEYPTAVRFASDGRIFVAEKSGRILVFASLDDPTPTLFADLSTGVYNFWDRGLLGLALDPGFSTTPYVYVTYTHDAEIGHTAPLWGSVGVLSDPCPDPPGSTDDGCVASGRLSRLEAVGDVMTGSERVLVEDWCQQYPSHSVGDIAFGADGALYASGGEGSNFLALDYGQFGDPPNPCGDPPTGVGGEQVVPTAEGGALRSQDLRTGGDPVGLSGTVIRVDPATGAARPDNPLSLSPDENARRIVAYGLRNPFRFAIRPGTNDVWIGDVGSDAAEEIDRIPTPADATAENFGWPCFEGSDPQGGYESLGLDLCDDLYGDGAVEPVYEYAHGEQVVPGDGCPLGTSSLAGMAFYTGGGYPLAYDGALFFADYSRRCIWAMASGDDGAPDPGSRIALAVDAAGPVDLEIGPGGDLFYVDFDGGTVRRISYDSGNAPPVAVAEASPSFGPAPLEVELDATGSTDGDDDALTFAWDLDGDGGFDDSDEAEVTHVYTEEGIYHVALRVTDPDGAFSTDTVLVTPGESPPTAEMLSPVGGTDWTVGQTIAFGGTATDAEDGALAPAALKWTLVLQHCPSTCHAHPIQSFDGVANGSFTAPDHEYPSHLELRLTVTDSAGLKDTEVLRLDPRTVPLTFLTSPVGLRLGFGSASAVTPFTREVIVGSLNSVAAPSPQLLDGTTYTFSSWSDARPQSHELVAPASAATLTATFQGPPPMPLPPLPAPPPPQISPTPQPPPPAAPRPARCVVPNVRGKTLVAARRALVAGRCRVGKVTRNYSRTVRTGRVVSQRPGPRARLARGAYVRLVISRGVKRKPGRRPGAASPSTG